MFSTYVEHPKKKEEKEKEDKENKLVTEIFSTSESPRDMSRKRKERDVCIYFYDGCAILRLRRRI